MSKKNRGNSKLDILLKEGASNIKSMWKNKFHAEIAYLQVTHAYIFGWDLKWNLSLYNLFVPFLETPNTMDKALASTAHRLLRETIQFAKATSTLNVADQYRQSG